MARLSPSDIDPRSSLIRLKVGEYKGERKVRRCSAVLSLILVSLVMSGCLFSGAGEIQTLELSASHDILGFGETVQLSAVGKTTKGKKTAVIADWKLVEGAGTLGESSFKASSWNYEGPVVLRASYQGVSAELTLTINDLLGEPNPFPRPSGPSAVLPKATSPDLYQIGEPVSNYAELITWWVNYPIDNFGTFKDMWSYFVRNGSIQIPGPVVRGSYAKANIADYVYEELLPEIPRLSRRVHYELIDSEVLEGGGDFSQTISYRQGTKLEQAEALFYRLIPVIATSYGWGWSSLAGNLEREIERRTQESVKLEQDKIATSTWSFASPDDALYYLHSAWVRVDTFYLSDSQGLPLEYSPVFAKYGFSSCPLEIRGDVVYVTWSW